MGTTQAEDQKILREVRFVSKQLDVVTNLLLNIVLSEPRFQVQRKLIDKVRQLDATGVDLRPADAGRILQRPSKDISSRRREYKCGYSKRSRKRREI